MDDKELERALKCDAAVPPEHRGIIGSSVEASARLGKLIHTPIEDLRERVAKLEEGSVRDGQATLASYLAANNLNMTPSPKEQPVFGHEQAEALFANLVDRVVALEAEVAALKAAKV